MSSSSKKSRIPSSKYKVSRRLMTSIWGSPKDSFLKKNTRPGQHKSSPRMATSDWGMHLQEKQKLKAHYGRITETQLRNLFDRARKMKGNTAENFINLLERKLYIAVYRLNFAPSIFAARQLVSHKHVLVNGKVVNIATFELSEGDKISLTEKAKSFQFCTDAIKNTIRTVPGYLSLDTQKKEGVLVSSKFSLDQAPFPFELDMGLVVEFYSR